MIIDYPSAQKLELWVIDSGARDTVAVFLNGRLVEFIADRSVHQYSIERPPEGTAIAIAVHFGGNDGGFSAIVDATHGSPRYAEKLGPNDGMRHSYVLRAVSS